MDSPLAPVAPPREWFDDPGLDAPTPLTITRDGRVYGHAATWDSCHVGYAGRCVSPPHSSSGYSGFHLTAIEAEDGELVHIGKITLAAGHASTGYGVDEEKARAHYDNSATIAAYVRAGEDEYGIWFSGALRSDITPEGRRDLLANAPSGDWRGQEMIAIHAVPTPGFPIPRATITASAMIYSTGLQPVDYGEVIDALAASILPPAVRLARPGLGR